MNELYSQLPDDFLEYQANLNLSRLAWREAGISFSEVQAMGEYDRAVLSIALLGF